MKKGFTLIELSVVLVIIGALLAGVLMAQSLIRTSKVQSIISDVTNFQSAISQFKQKFSALPGDMGAAQTYWGVNANCASTGIGSGTQTCNGNGDGQIGLTSSAPYEQFLVWQHLSNAGMIQGNFTGAAISGAGTAKLYCSPGVNCPGGKLKQQAYFLTFAAGTLLGTANYWTQPAGHFLIVGANTNSAGSTSGLPGFPLLSASEAFSLDNKIDDGLPGTGVWKSVEATGLAGYTPNCVVTTGTTTPPSDGTVTSAANSAYYIAYGTAPACSLAITLSF